MKIMFKSMVHYYTVHNIAQWEGKEAAKDEASCHNIEYMKKHF